MMIGNRMMKINRILKKIKIRNLIVLIFLLIFNTYAWFVYATRVSTNLTAHVSSWNVEFTTGEGEIVTNINIDVDRIYPGMETFEKIIEVHNKGETKALLDYKINEVKILDEYYTSREENGMTSEELEEKIKTDYPFKIQIEKDEQELAEGNGNGSFKITVEWPFESGNDENDTLWGNKAYEYYSVNPNEQSIALNLTLIATQQNKN